MLIPFPYTSQCSLSVRLTPSSLKHQTPSIACPSTWILVLGMWSLPKYMRSSLVLETPSFMLNTAHAAASFAASCIISGKNYHPDDQRLKGAGSWAQSSHHCVLPEVQKVVKKQQHLSLRTQAVRYVCYTLYNRQSVCLCLFLSLCLLSASVSIPVSVAVSVSFCPCSKVYTSSKAAESLAALYLAGFSNNHDILYRLMRKVFSLCMHWLPSVCHTQRSRSRWFPRRIQKRVAPSPPIAFYHSKLHQRRDGWGWWSWNKWQPTNIFQTHPVIFI